MNTSLSLFPLVLALAAAAQPEPLERSTRTSALPASGGVADGFAELDAEYEAAYEAWREKLSAAEDLAARRELRSNPPAEEFWARFEALADGGEGRALLWLVSHVREKGVKASERGAFMQPYYEKLCAEHASADWFGDVLAQLDKDDRRLGEESVLALYATVVEKSESDEHRAGALFQAAAVLDKSEAQGAAEKAAAYRARIESEFADTRWAAQLEQFRAQERVQVGKVAPDFQGKTIDGFEFKLSDYRGKVVLLDFYGFW